MSIVANHSVEAIAVPVTKPQPIRKPRPKPIRKIGVMLPIHGKNPGIIRIEVAGVAHDYYLSRVGSDWGDGFLIEKIDHEESYHVNLSDEGHSCDCKGFLRHGHCKHVEGLVALRQRQLI